MKSIAQEARDAIRNAGYKPLCVTEGKTHLWPVLAKRADQIEYVTWIYNTQDHGLYFGYYGPVGKLDMVHAVFEARCDQHCEG